MFGVTTIAPSRSPRIEGKGQPRHGLRSSGPGRCRRACTFRDFCTRSLLSRVPRTGGRGCRGRRRFRPCVSPGGLFAGEEPLPATGGIVSGEGRRYTTAAAERTMNVCPRYGGIGGGGMFYAGWG